MNESENREMTLVKPALIPCNGRIVMQAINKKDYRHGNFIIPVNFEMFEQKKSNREEQQERNPYKNFDFFVVALAPEVNMQIKLENDLKIEIGDRVIISERFEPIVYPEGPDRVYFLIHWQDTLGIIKNKALIREKEQG